jgi:hypothetical protein
MSAVAATTAAAVSGTIIEALNPLEMSIAAFNTNPYFIGLTMLLLNLGGRFLAMEVTKEQEKFFQNLWVRGLLIFVVVFVATRNIIVAFWLSLIVIIFIRLLFNENSSFYFFRRETPTGKLDTPAAPSNVLTPEEADIYRKLTDKMAKAATASPSTKDTKEEKPYNIVENYFMNMARLSV